MAFSKKYIPYSRAKYFTFFADGDGAAANMDEDIDFSGKPFELAGIRVTFSGVCSADIYLRGYIDSPQSTHSTRYDGYFFSYALSNSIFYQWQPSVAPMLFQASDVVTISCITDNVFSVTAWGWAVNGEA
jgi:hypothetical protein